MLHVSGRTAPRFGFILWQRLAFLVVACATFGLCLWLMPVQASDTQRQEPASEQVSEDGIAERLIAKHDCWTGAAPADMEGQIPGHVVVTRADKFRPVLGGDVLVGQALEQLFDGIDHDLRIHAFCR